jgi:hypothetical protein
MPTRININSDFLALGLPTWACELPTLTCAGFFLAAIFLIIAIIRNEKDFKYLALSSLAYGLVPLWPMLNS